MKVCTRLNPLHTTLAVFGCLLGYTLISKAVDPLLETLQPHFEGVHLGGSYDIKTLLAPILKREDIFGVDLTASVLGEKVEKLFAGMIERPGAIAAILTEKYA